MTSMRMRLTCTVSLSALCIGGERGGWGGGGFCVVFLFLLCVLVGAGDWEIGTFRIGFCGDFLQFPGTTVPTLDFLHMPAWPSMCI